jgi:hypothetical protein
MKATTGIIKKELRSEPQGPSPTRESNKSLPRLPRKRQTDPPEEAQLTTWLPMPTIPLPGLDPSQENVTRSQGGHCKKRFSGINPKLTSGRSCSAAAQDYHLPRRRHDKSGCRSSDDVDHHLLVK